MKKILVIILTVVLMSTLALANATPVSAATNSLVMYHYDSSTQYRCGPCSGTSIGEYYRTQVDRNGDGIPDYQYLPSPNANMYDRLYDYMDTAILGTTYAYKYGPGFVEMALHYGYDNFSYVYDGNVTNEDKDYDGVPDDYEVIQDAINNGWPIGLASNGLLVGFKGVEALPGSGPQYHTGSPWPCTVWHFIAIKGYYDNYWDGSIMHAHVLICTDSYSGCDYLLLDWYQLIAKVGQFLEAVIIKDVDDTPDGSAVEDFEWGNDTTSLSAWGGEVEWGVTASSGSVAEIDDGVWHPGIGTRSARFYRASSKIVYAYYSLWRPSYIGFWVMKDDTAYTTIANGDGNKYIWVRIDDAEKIQYYGSSGYVTLSYTFPVGAWRQIEFRNIDWGAGTYDIYVNNSYKTTATMRAAISYKGNLYFESRSGSGTFWIDDINDSLRSGVGGVVVNGSTGGPLQNAAVTARKAGEVVGVTQTDSAGRYQIDLVPDTYSLTASRSGYSNATYTVVVSECGLTTRNFSLVPSGGGGGCPFLSVWDGSEYVDEGLLNVHNADGVDVTYEHSLTAEPERVNGAYEFRLVEHPKTISHIDQVQLQAILEDGTVEELPLISAQHSDDGNVLNLLLKSDDRRVEELGADHNGGTSQSIDLRFAALKPNAKVVAFTFTIEGNNIIIK